MGVTVTVPVLNANHASELMEQIQASGLVNGLDFRWYFHPKTYDYYNSDNNHNAELEIDFTDPKMATYFKLKWS